MKYTNAAFLHWGRGKTRTFKVHSKYFQAKVLHEKYDYLHHFQGVFFLHLFLGTYTFQTELQQIGGCSEKTDRLTIAMQNLALDFLVRLDGCQGK